MTPSRRVFRALLPLLAGGMVAGASAAPVRSDDIGPDAFELALQWTLASLTPQPAWPHATAAAPAAPAAPGQPAVLPAAAVPDPGAYALMGLLLVAGGLAAQRLARRRGPPGGAQRGLSKKT